MDAPQPASRETHFLSHAQLLIVDARLPDTPKNGVWKNIIHVDQCGTSLVGGLEPCFFFKKTFHNIYIYMGKILPTDELHHFSR